MIRHWRLRIDLYDLVRRYDEADEDPTSEEVLEIARECAERLERSGWLELVAEDEYRRDTLAGLFDVLRACDTIEDFNETLGFVWDEADDDRVIVNTTEETS